MKLGDKLSEFATYLEKLADRMDKWDEEADTQVSSLPLGVAKEALAKPGWTVEQEREACAKIADAWQAKWALGTSPYVTLSEVTHDIRARQIPSDNAAPAEEMERQDLAAEKDGAVGQTVERLILAVVVWVPNNEVVGRISAKVNEASIARKKASELRSLIRFSGF